MAMSAMPPLSAVVVIAYRKKEMQAAEQLARELSSLNLSDMTQVLRWLGRVATFRYVDTVVAFPWEQAVGMFQEQGHEARRDLSPDIFDAGQDEAARAIIAFALNGMMGNGFSYRHVPSDVIAYIRHWLATHSRPS